MYANGKCLNEKIVLGYFLRKTQAYFTPLY